MSDPLTLEAAAAQLQGGDVLVVRSPHRLSDAECVRLKQQMEAFWAEQGYRVPVLVLDDGLTLETISADRIRALGWVRIEEVRMDPEV